MAPKSGPEPEAISSPILKEATLEMFIDVAANDAGEVAVTHDRPFPEVVSWLEYDQETKRLDFISEVGQIRFLGVYVPPVMEEKMRQTQEAMVFHINFNDGEILETKILPLVFKIDIGF